MHKKQQQRTWFRWAAALVGLAVLFGGVGVAGAGTSGVASARTWVNGADIKPGSVTQNQVGPGGISGHGKTPESEIQGNSIAQQDIGPGGVSGSDGPGDAELQAGTVGKKDLSADLLAWLAQQAGQGPKGDKGEKGDTGAKGDKGDRGEPGLSELESDGPYPGATQLQDGANSTAKWTGDEGASLQRSWVQCPDGKTAVGGGYSRADEGAVAFKGLQVVTSQPVQIVNGDPTAYDPIEGDADGSYVPNGWLVEGFNNGTTDLIVRPHVVCAVVNAAGE